MKKIIIILLFVNLFSCSKDNKQIKSIDDIYPVIDTIKDHRNYTLSYIRLYVIDSCEYIGNINDTPRDIFTHKGNCKYCLIRNKK